MFPQVKTQFSLTQKSYLVSLIMKKWNPSKMTHSTVPVLSVGNSVHSTNTGRVIDP